MLMETLQKDMITSLKAGKSDRVETIRFLIAAIRNLAIDKYGNTWETSLTDADIVDVVKKQIKTHRESIEAFEKGGRLELADKEKMQLSILQEFAPKEMTDDELKALLAPVVASGEQSFGLLMKTAMAAVKGQADGGKVAALLKQMTKS